jgi:hypothetical protein
LSVERDFIEQNVAADPSGAASGDVERLAFFYGCKRERETRDGIAVQNLGEVGGGGGGAEVEADYGG